MERLREEHPSWREFREEAWEEEVEVDETAIFSVFE